MTIPTMGGSLFMHLHTQQSLIASSNEPPPRTLEASFHAASCLDSALTRNSQLFMSPHVHKGLPVNPSAIRTGMLHSSRKSEYRAETIVPEVGACFCGVAVLSGACCTWDWDRENSMVASGAPPQRPLVSHSFEN